MSFAATVVNDRHARQSCSLTNCLVYLLTRNLSAAINSQSLFPYINNIKIMIDLGLSKEEELANAKAQAIASLRISKSLEKSALHYQGDSQQTPTLKDIHVKRVIPNTSMKTSRLVSPL